MIFGHVISPVNTTSFCVNVSEVQGSLKRHLCHKGLEDIFLPECVLEPEDFRVSRVLDSLPPPITVRHPERKLKFAEHLLRGDAQGPLNVNSFTECFPSLKASHPAQGKQ